MPLTQDEINQNKAKATTEDKQGYVFKESNYYVGILQDNLIDEQEPTKILQPAGMLKIAKKNEPTAYVSKLEDVIVLSITPGRQKFEGKQVVCKSINGKTSMDGLSCNSSPVCSECKANQRISLLDLKQQYVSKKPDEEDDGPKIIYLNATGGSFKETYKYLNEKLSNTPPHFYTTTITTQKQTSKNSPKPFFVLNLDPIRQLTEVELQLARNKRKKIITDLENNLVADEAHSEAAEGF